MQCKEIIVIYAGMTMMMMIIIIIVIIIVIGSTTLGGPWPPRTNVASDLYPGQPPSNFYNPVSL